MADRTELMTAYPQAFEDDHGTIWISREHAIAADWTYEHGDAFLEGILGWDWNNAVENRQYTLAKQKKQAFWAQHPILHRVCRFLVTRKNFIRMFCGTVWRDWYGRISWSTAWKIASDVCLKER
jgi:hypothetical protein